MVTIHADKFNDAINQHGRMPEKFDEHDSVLWHEGRMYDLIKDYVAHIGEYTSQQLELALRHIKWHVESIMAYTGLDIDSWCVTYELIDIQSARLAA